MQSVSKVDPKTLRAVVHYAEGGRTLCGRVVGGLRLKWFPLPPQRATCATCLRARADKQGGR